MEKGAKNEALIVKWWSSSDEEEEEIQEGDKHIPSNGKNIMDNITNMNNNHQQQIDDNIFDDEWVLGDLSEEMWKLTVDIVNNQDKTDNRGIIFERTPDGKEDEEGGVDPTIADEEEEDISLTVDHAATCLSPFFVTKKSKQFNLPLTKKGNPPELSIHCRLASTPL